MKREGCTPGGASITRRPDSAEGTPCSSPETRANFFAALKENDVAITGRRTFDAVRDMMLHALRTEQGHPLGIVQTRHPAAYAEQAVEGRLEFTDLGPSALVADLEARGYEALLVGSGGEIYGSFAAAGLVDEWIIVIEPLLLVGGTPPVLSGRRTTA
jgi:riboflavin biosynthesis pyrimidine reductase